MLLHALALGWGFCGVTTGDAGMVLCTGHRHGGSCRLQHPMAKIGLRGLKSSRGDVAGKTLWSFLLPAQRLGFWHPASLELPLRLWEPWHTEEWGEGELLLLGHSWSECARRLL